MNKSRKTLLIVGLVIIVILLVVIMIIKKPNLKAPVVNNQEPSAQQTATTSSPEPQGTDNRQTDQFKAPVPTDIQIPTVNQQLSEEQKKVVAVPTVVTAAAPGVSAQFRSFNISGDQGKFSPSKIIGRIGDTIHVNVTASDKDYDIVFPSYNMKGTIRKGETKVMEFQAVQEGDFTFYCEMCGGPDSTASGHIIIAK